MDSYTNDAFIINIEFIFVTHKSCFNSLTVMKRKRKRRKGKNRNSGKVVSYMIQVYGTWYSTIYLVQDVFYKDFSC